MTPKQKIKKFILETESLCNTPTDGTYTDAAGNTYTDGTTLGDWIEAGEWDSATPAEIANEWDELSDEFAETA